MISMDNEIEIYEHTLTCETAGCENAGLGIMVATTIGSTCICGACGFQITNITVGALVPPVDIPIDLPTTPPELPVDTNGQPPAAVEETL